MTARFIAWLLPLAAACAPGWARAQGIDCGAARTATERAICADPHLLTLDARIAETYGAIVAARPDRAANARGETLAWLRARDVACDGPAAQLPACLSGQLEARLAALQAEIPDTPAAAAPPSPPAAAARLDATTLPPRAGHAETLLHVTAPGRFSLRAHHPAGASLQLIDQLDGPFDVARDGRLDTLLDIGTYKIRLETDPKSSEPITLEAVGFKDAAPAALLPEAGAPLATDLRDGQQRSFWIAVRGPVRIGASGRALADLRLWRDGRNLAALEPTVTTSEAAPGHMLRALTLDGRVEPGVYRVTAYGGAPLGWARDTDQAPFFIRAGGMPDLAAGAITGTLDASGEAVFALPPWVASLRLDLPAPADIALDLGDRQEGLSRKDREPTVRVAVNGETHAVLRGAAGQAFTLRAGERIGPASVSAPGAWWLAAITAGLGGDEPPPTFLLTQRDPAQHGSKTRIETIAETLPRVGPHAAYRARFNLRGPTTLLLRAEAGPVAVNAQGVPLTERSTGDRALDINAGIGVLTLVPEPNARGALDLTVGPPGETAGLAVPALPDPTVSFGVRTLAPGQTVVLDGPRGPGIEWGLSGRPVPVALAAGPLFVTQLAGQPVTVPVALAPRDQLRAGVLGDAAPLPLHVDQGPSGDTVTIPSTDTPRTVVLGIQPPALPHVVAPPTPPGQDARVTAGTPAWFDLPRGGTTSFALTVPIGGLTRIETLGRMATSGRVGTPFLPGLAEATGGGAGQNMLLLTYLRAGEYRVGVRAEDGSGHLGLLASAAPTQQAPVLRPGGGSRPTVPAGSGLVIPLDIPGEGAAMRDLRLTVMSQAGEATARLEDAEGWPITRAGPFADRRVSLRPGGYRLVVEPRPTIARVVATTEPDNPAPSIEGHGPHPLPFERTIAATWREPPPGEADRPSDRYIFSLAGEAHATLTIGLGMIGDLSGPGGAHARFDKRWTGTLAAGDWTLDASAQGHNDRLPYTLRLQTDELQPGTPRRLGLGARAIFTVAADRIVTIRSNGNAPVKAVLRRDGAVVARLPARADDWNVGASRPLPAGRYEIELVSDAPPDTNRIYPRPDSSPPGDPDDSASGEMQQTPDSPDSAEAGQGESRDAGAAGTPGEPGASNDSDQPMTTLTIDLPSRMRTLDPRPAPPDSLVLATTRADGTAVVSLERQDGTAWRVVATDQGPTATAAALAGGGSDGGTWRARAWSLDDPDAAVIADLRTVTDAPPRALAPVDGTAAPVAAARIRLDTPSVLRVAGAERIAGWPGHAATAPHGQTALAQGKVIWLLGRAAGPVSATEETADPISLVLAPGEAAALPADPAATGLRLWRADAGTGQPSFGALPGTAQIANEALAPGSAVTLGPPLLTNAAADDAAMRATVSRLDFARPTEGALGAGWSALLPPHGAVRLRAEAAALTLTLPPNVAALPEEPREGISREGVSREGVWGAEAGVTRTVPGGTWIVANLGPTAAPASALPAQIAEAVDLVPGTVLKRFFGAAGSFLATAAIPEGGKLALLGDGALLVTDARGHVLSGRTVSPAPGPARLTVTHGPGALALASAGPGHDPWAGPPAQPLAPPATRPLAGPAMAFAIPVPGPSLLRASTTAPVILRLDDEPPAFFTAGAEISRAVRGPATLRLFAPTDGPLAGTLAVSLIPIGAMEEGLGEPVAVAPGGAAAWRFALAKPRTIGIGVRATPDVVSVRLLDSTGAVRGDGVAQLQSLPAGEYVLEASVPPDAAPTTVGPALVGLTPPPTTPPADIVANYLELAGLKPKP